MTAERVRRPEREAPELAAMMRRMLRALVRRAQAGDLFALEALRALQRDSAQALADGARAAHDGPAHYSYGEIAGELGMTRQGAFVLAGQGRPLNDG